MKFASEINHLINNLALITLHNTDIMVELGDDELLETCGEP